MNQTIELLQNHRSVRSYQDKPISNDVEEQLLTSGQWASTSSNVQAYSVISVRDQAKKEKLRELTGNPHVESCALFFVFCADLHRIKTAVQQHEAEIEPKLENTEAFLVASVDTALMAQNVMIAAESLGIGGCYIGGIRNNPQEVSDLLKLPSLVYPVFGMTLGYPKNPKEQRPRLPLRAIRHEETYQEENLKPAIDEYDQTTKAYYQSRSTNQKLANWSDHMAKMFSIPRRTHLRNFLEKRGFLQKD